MSGKELWQRVPAREKTVELLQNSAGAPCDAYLFVSRDRTKTEAARAFAAAILCEESCGRCDVCRRVLGGLHPDVQIFEPEGYTFPVELIRQIVHAASQSPMESNRRVFILEEADRIAERSQNALLKALEEPSPSVTWILAADSVEAFLSTILSRCQLVEFPPLGLAAIEDLLESRFGLDAGQAAAVAAQAAGSLEKAVALASDELARRTRTIAFDAAVQPQASLRWALETAEAVGQIALEARAAADEAHKVELADFDDAMGKGRGAAGGRKRIIDRHKRQLRRIETDVFLDFLFWLGTAFRDLAALSAGAPQDALIFGDYEAQTRSAAPVRDGSFWLDMAQASSESHLAIRENANPSLALEALLLRLAA